VLASLNHPNIAAIHGVEESGGWKFLIMELVQGETLARSVRAPLSPARDTTSLRTEGGFSC
jgi:serine/threonine-protein kinase